MTKKYIRSFSHKFIVCFYQLIVYFDKLYKVAYIYFIFLNFTSVTTIKTNINS